MATRINAFFDSRLPVNTAVSYARGARVNGAQASVSTVTVHAGHEISTGELFLYALTPDNILWDRVFTAGTITGTTVPFTGNTFSFPDGAYLVPLGADTGGTQNADGSFELPNYDGSTVTMYTDANGDDSIVSVGVAPDGDAGHYTNVSPIWMLGLTNGNRPVSVLLDIGGASGAFLQTRGTSFPTAPDLGDEHVLVTTGANPDIKYIYMKLSTELSDWVEVVSAP